MNEKDIAIREIYIALEICRRRCEEYEDLREFPGRDIDNLMTVFSDKFLDKSS